MTSNLPISVIILEYVCPILGAILSNVMYLAPVRSVQKAARVSNLGDTDPTPWAFQQGATIGFVAYGIVVGDYFVFGGNVLPLLIGAWLNLQAIKVQHSQKQVNDLKRSIVRALQQRQQREQEPATSRQLQEETPRKKCEESLGSSSSTDDSRSIPSSANPEPTTSIIWGATNGGAPPAAAHERIVTAVIIVWVAVISFVACSNFLSHAGKQNILGLGANLMLLAFYVSPISTIRTVIRTRCSDSIHRLTLWTNVINVAFWMAYGFAIMDWWIIAPNPVAASISGTQVLLTIIFPRTSKATDGAKLVWGKNLPIVIDETERTMDEETGDCHEAIVTSRTGFADQYKR